MIWKREPNIWRKNGAESGKKRRESAGLGVIIFEGRG
jgi:hypothetical protein